MAAAPGVRAFLSLRRSMMLQYSFGLSPVQIAPTCLPRSLSSATTSHSAPKPRVSPENKSLLENLNLMGVDVKMARQRQPGVLRTVITNEQGVAQFLQGKGASRKVIASIISRYPRAVTRSIQHLEQRWALWKNIFKTDAEIVSILDRSPEPFFRSSDNENLEKNIAFMISLGLNSKDLHRLLTTAPRTFSNSFELNRQMIEFLEGICTELGGKNPEHFAKTIISRNVYILITSTKRVNTNIHNLRASLKLHDSELLALLQSRVAEILHLSNEYMKKNFNSLQQKMVSLGCQKADIQKLVISYPMILYIGADTLNAKLDCLLKGGITVEQIVKKPKVLEFSIQNLSARLEDLQRVGYDFQKSGVNILDNSQKRFTAKIEKLAATRDD